MNELNFALNSVVYIMIFIFPGFLFRKFLFRREYSKEFDKGNLFERTILTLLTSVMVLFIVGGLVWILKNGFDQTVLPSLTYDIIALNLNKISHNDIPSFDAQVFKDLGILLLSLYSSAIIFGWLTYKISNTRLFKYFGIFKYDNYWDGLIKGSHYRINDDTLIYNYTLADVLTDGSGETVLYSGRVIDYFLKVDTLEIQTIVLADVKKYSRDKGTGTTTLKDIPGNNLILERDKILNYNFSYIYTEKIKGAKAATINSVINLISIILFILIFSVFFIDDVNQYLSTVLRKIIFVLVGWVWLMVLNGLLKNILMGLWSQIKNIDVFFVLFLPLPYLWIFNIFPWYLVLIGMIMLLAIYSYFFPEKNNDS